MNCALFGLGLGIFLLLLGHILLRTHKDEARSNSIRRMLCYKIEKHGRNHRQQRKTEKRWARRAKLIQKYAQVSNESAPLGAGLRMTLLPGNMNYDEKLDIAITSELGKMLHSVTRRSRKSESDQIDIDIIVDNILRKSIGYVYF